MVGKLLGGGLVLLGTALLCRAETRTRQQQTERLAELMETLRRHRPNLLIAGYHRSEDLWRLPLEVLAIQPEYKVYVRHYPCLPAWDVNFYFV